MNHKELANKATRVVVSCTNRKQLTAAQKYAELFFKKSRDVEHFRSLVIRLNEKIDSLA
jgi:hypothetical protein